MYVVIMQKLYNVEQNDFHVALFGLSTHVKIRVTIVGT